jgi:hypothetical protein
MVAQANVEIPASSRLFKHQFAGPDLVRVETRGSCRDCLQARGIPAVVTRQGF